MSKSKTLVVILVCLFGYLFAHNIIEPTKLNQNVIPRCPAGYSKNQRVEIKCGSSSEWAVIDNPSIELWNPICRTRSSWVCIENNEEKQDKLDVAKSKLEPCHSSIKYVQMCRTSLSFQSTCVAVPETQVHCGRISKNKAGKFDLNLPNVDAAGSQREGESLLNRNFNAYQVIPEVNAFEFSHCRPEFIQNCRNIPVAGSRRPFLSHCETLQGVSRNCAKRRFTNELLPTTQKINLGAHARPIIKKPESPAYNGNRGPDTKNLLQTSRVLPATRRNGQETGTKSLLRVNKKLCRKKVFYAKKCTKGRSPRCQMVRKIRKGCKHQTSTNNDVLARPNIKDTFLNNDTISNQSQSKFQDAQSIGKLDGTVLDEINTPELSSENVNTMPKHNKIKAGSVTSSSEKNDMGLSVKTSEIQINVKSHSTNNHRTTVEENNEVREVLENSTVLAMPILTSEINEKVNVLNVLLPSSEKTLNLNIRDNITFNDGFLSVEGKMHDAELKTNEIFKNKDKSRFIKDLPNVFENSIKSHAKEANSKRTENTVVDHHLKFNENDETFGVINSDAIEKKVNVLKNMIVQNTSTEKAKNETLEEIPAGDTSPEDKVSTEMIPPKSKASVFSCAEREVCEEFIEKKCGQRKGPRPETICSDIALEDCTVLPSGTAYETCDTIFNKYCRPRLTNVKDRIYDESLKEKQRSISFNGKDGQHFFETLFEDEFNNLFHDIEEEEMQEEGKEVQKICKETEIEYCNTHYALEVDVGKKWSCLDVPAVSCETFYNIDGRLVKNCIQTKAKRCQQFNVVGNILHPVTECKKQNITHCSLEGRPRKFGFELVDCEEEKKHLCGPHHTTELVLNQCSWDFYPSCQKITTSLVPEKVKANSNIFRESHKFETISNDFSTLQNGETCRDIVTKKCRMVTDCNNL